MAIDNRPTFGQTLLKGMLEKAQLDQEKERTKILKDQQKIAEEEFKLQVQKFSFEQQTQKKLEGFRDRSLEQQRELQLEGFEVQREDTASRESIAAARNATDEALTRLREAGADRRTRQQALVTLGQTAGTLAQSKASMMLEFMDRGYAGPAAAIMAGSTGSLESDMAIIREQLMKGTLGQDASALTNLEDMLIGNDRFIRVGLMSGLDQNLVPWARSEFNRLKAAGQDTLSEDDVTAMLQEVSTFAEENKKALFPSMKGDERQAALEEWVKKQHQSVLLTAGLAFDDMSIGENFRNDAELNATLVESLEQEQGAIDPKLGAFASRFRNALFNAGTPFPGTDNAPSRTLQRPINLENDLRFRQP